MNTARADELIRRLIELAEPSSASQPPGEHADPEDLALLIEGRLPEAGRTPILEHLANCQECRTWAAELLQQESEQPVATTATSRSASAGWFASSRHWLAVAAAILLLASVAAFYWPGRGRLTEQTAYLQAKEQLALGQFDKAQDTLARARDAAIESDRLRSLEAQSLRQIPDPLALARAGRLSDFGYELGGIVARDPQGQPFRTGLSAARDILGEQASRDLELLLNRGHLYLSLNELDVARRDFADAIELDPREPLAWLGAGLAAFLADDYPAAEQAFRQATEIDPRNLSARINLAMTLQERDKVQAAIAEWRLVLADKRLDKAERTNIEAVLRRLQEKSP